MFQVGDVVSYEGLSVTVQIVIEGGFAASYSFGAERTVNKPAPIYSVAWVDEKGVYNSKNKIPHNLLKLIEKNTRYYKFKIGESVVMKSGGSSMIVTGFSDFDPNPITWINKKLDVQRSCLCRLGDGVEMPEGIWEKLLKPF